jgi:sugar (pentulose or hexulose) kinase
LERICSLLGVVSQEEKINLGTAAQAVESNISSINVTNNYHGLSINNLDDAGSPATLFRATVEHLAEESATMVSLMEKYTGKAKSVTIAGGWINNPVIAAAKTKQFGSYKVSDTPEAGATGAAEFAGIAAGCFKFKT